VNPLPENRPDRLQRLASLGLLAAGVAHEIRNPLSVMRSETERLADTPRDLDYLKRHRDLMLKHIDRLDGIVKKILGLSKNKDKQQVEVDLNEVIETTLQFFAFKRVAIKKELKPTPKVKGDPGELQEVFINLIQNALDAMPDGGELRLRANTTGGRAAVEISDTGKGMSEETSRKIFDPFYSTREAGVGLGLSIVERIVREHGGTISVESNVGKGTTFKLLF
jgi:two-component system NtrC family sensor kinase